MKRFAFFIIISLLLSPFICSETSEEFRFFRDLRDSGFVTAEFLLRHSAELELSESQLERIEERYGRFHFIKVSSFRNIALTSMSLRFELKKTDSDRKKIAELIRESSVYKEKLFTEFIYYIMELRDILKEEQSKKVLLILKEKRKK